VGMAWEWVAPVAAAGGASIGSLTTWLAGQGSRRHTEALAREARRQQRFADAYIELLITVEAMGQWAQLVRPMLDVGMSTPSLPSFEQQARVQALLAGYATPQVKALFETYSESIREIVKIDQRIADVIHFGDREIGVSRGELWQRLDMTLRPAEAAARKALANQVSIELAG
ncbi:hypothetical protein, partial [Amycolatopsis thermoflava]|uniref:hypothetical protein n=1 Tax=Amycolatopsis thermoflava TaxID=84480 RepID=UPI003EB7FA38